MSRENQYQIGTIQQGNHPYPVTYGPVKELIDFDDPNAIAHVPPLEYALAAVLEHNFQPMAERLHALPNAHISPFFLESLYANAINRDKPFLVFQHEATRTAQEKLKVLEKYRGLFQERFGSACPFPQPLKTRTARYKVSGTTGYQNSLITGIGDIKLSKPQIRAITGTKDITLNPKEFDPVANLGVYSGVVSPFLDPGHTKGISSIIWMNDESEPEQPVEIAASPIESIVIFKRDVMAQLQVHIIWSYEDVIVTQEDGFTRYSFFLPM